MDGEKKMMNEEELTSVNGGAASPNSGWYMTVCVPSGYLGLMCKPEWNRYLEFAQMPKGATVYTNGRSTSGTGLNGTPCQYRWVCYNGQWGWANAAYLH